jgi:low temperature requirement protein LtrA
MQESLPNIRRWWRTPRRLSERERERRVTFLELFYDLVYVVVVAEIGHHLAAHVDGVGLFEATLLFVLVWVAWVNGSMYHDLHGQNDLRTRVFTFGQMFTVAGMAICAHNAFGAGAAGFAASFAAYLALVGFLWWRTGVYDPDHRPLSQPYALTFLVALLLFVGSIIAPEQWRVALWVTALLALVLLPLRPFFFQPTDPRVLAQLERSVAVSPSTVERFGLFTIIVLGEVIIAVVRGVAAHEHLDGAVFANAGLGMLLAIGLWWVYFGIIAQRIPIRSRAASIGWAYLHLPLTLGITATGAATLNVVEHASEPLTDGVRWLLVGAIAVTLGSVALLTTTLHVPHAHRPYYTRAAVILAGASVGALVVGLLNLPTIISLLVLVTLVLAPVLYEVYIWIKVFGGAEIALESTEDEPSAL